MGMQRNPEEAYQWLGLGDMTIYAMGREKNRYQWIFSSTVYIATDGKQLRPQSAFTSFSSHFMFATHSLKLQQTSMEEPDTQIPHNNLIHVVIL